MGNAGRTRVRFKINPLGVTALATSKPTEEVLVGIGSKIAETAKGYGGRFSSKRWYTETSRTGSQVVVRAGTDQPAAHWDEWGNYFRAPRAPLRRALTSLRLWEKTQAASR